MKYPFLIPQLPQPEEWLPHLEVSYRAGHYSNNGPLSQILGNKMERLYLDSGYKATLVTSNTLGLQSVFHALGLENKKIAVPDFTFAATIQSILNARAIPVVFDVSRKTGELDHETVAQYLIDGNKLDAIVHVRCFGLIRDTERIKELAAQFKIPLIIDAAAALSAPAERRFGSDHGEIEVFSLHATKVFAIGEGGLIAAPAKHHNKIQSAINFGFKPDRTYSSGTNAKLDEFRCAIGLAMTEKIEQLIRYRQQHAKKYIELFKGGDFATPLCKEINNSWSMFPIILNKQISNQIVKCFYDQGIEVKRYYYPGILSGYVSAKDFESFPVPNSEHIQSHILCLPVYSKDISEFWGDMSIKLSAAIEMSSETA